MEKDTISISKQIYWRIYYWLFVERFNKKIDFNFKKNIYRWDLINFLIIFRNTCNIKFLKIKEYE